MRCHLSFFVASNKKLVCTRRLILYIHQYKPVFKTCHTFILYIMLVIVCFYSYVFREIPYYSFIIVSLFFFFHFSIFCSISKVFARFWYIFLSEHIADDILRSMLNMLTENCLETGLRTCFWPLPKARPSDFEFDATILIFTCSHFLIDHILLLPLSFLVCPKSFKNSIQGWNTESTWRVNGRAGN